MGIVAYYFEPGTDISVDWGDGVVQSYGLTSGEGVVRDATTNEIIHIEAIHNYVEDGLYDVKITGHVEGVMHPLYNLVDLKQWGETTINRFGSDPNRNLASLFYNVQGFRISAVDAPILPVNCSFRELFAGCLDFDSPIGHWDTDTVISLRSTFEGALAFNQELPWRVGRVTDFGWTFAEATRFNRNINSWDTVSANNMEAMFYFASVYNQPMNLWNTGNVLSMFSMLNGAAAFDQDLSMLNVANVGECTWFAEGSPINGTAFMPPLTCALQPATTTV